MSEPKYESTVWLHDELSGQTIFLAGIDGSWGFTFDANWPVSKELPVPDFSPHAQRIVRETKDEFGDRWLPVFAAREILRRRLGGFLPYDGHGIA